MIYGIILNDHADPYIVTRHWDQLMGLLRHSLRLTEEAAADYTFTVVEANPECAWCDDEVGGWWAIEAEPGDYTEPPLHDHCRKAYGEQQDAMHYV